MTYNGVPIPGREPTAQELADFYRRQLDRLGTFIMLKYTDEITAEMELEPTAVEIAIRLLNYGKTTDGVLARLHRKEW